jgi:hypothetical protein
MTTNIVLLPDEAARTRRPVMDGRARVGLALLWQAYTHAQDAGAELWDFALEIEKLYETQMTISDLRWLVAKKFVEHGRETSVSGSPHRSFQPSDGYFFETTTCVVLTLSGAAYARQFLGESVASPQSTPVVDVASSADAQTVARDNEPPAARDRNGSTAAACKPHWNATRGELSLGGTVVKCFRVPAHNQELILCAFEEDGWPEAIDDPLPVIADIDPPTRLHDAIRRLNGCQTNRLLRFHGNGDGDGVSWEFR